MIDLELAGLGKRGGDVSYGRGLERVSRAARGECQVPVNRKYNEYYETHPGWTAGITTSTVPSAVVMVFLNANVLRKLSLVRSEGRISPSSLVYRHEDDGGSQRSNVAGSPEEVVQVTVIGLAERTSVVGWLSCKAEITGRTRRRL